MACVSNSTSESPAEFDSSYSSGTPSSSSSSLSSKTSKLSVSSLVSSTASSKKSSTSTLPPWSPRVSLSSPPATAPVSFYLRFSPAERAFLHELTLLNGVIDRILPMLNRNPEPSLLTALCDYASRLIARSGCTLGQRTYYVFRALYRETSAKETRPYLVQRATAEVVDYIRQHFSYSIEWQKKKKKQNSQAQQEQQQQSIEELLSIVVNVLGLYIDNPLCSTGFAALTAVLQDLGLVRDKTLASLFAFSPAEAKVMRRAICDDGENIEVRNEEGGKFSYEYEFEDD